MPIITQKNFTGGVNEEDFIGDLAANEVRVAVNAILTKKGSLKKRDGSSEYGTDAGGYAVYGLKGFTDDTNTLRRFKVVNNNVVEYNTGAWDTVVKTPLTPNLYLQMSDIKCAAAVATTSGTASAGADYSLTKSGAGWVVNDYRDFLVKITGGTGVGQVKTILENTAEILYVDGHWDENPDATSTFEIYEKVSALVCNNGTDTAFKIVGITATDLPGMLKFTQQVVVNNRLWGILGTKIYWSDLANGEAIPEANYIDTGEDLISVGRVGDYVAIYSKTKTGVVIGISANDFAFKWRDYARGCIAPQSVAHWNGYSICLAQGGVYAFDGNSNRLVSRKITPSIKDIKSSLLNESFGFVFDNKYYLLHAQNSVSSIKDRIWVMDLVWSDLSTGSGVWTVFEGLNPNVMGTFQDSNGLLNLYIGKSNSSKVVKLYDGTYNDSNSSIKLDIQSPEFDNDVIGQMKRYGWFFFEGATQNVSSDLQVYKNIDNNGFELFATIPMIQSGGLWDVSIWDVDVFGGAERIVSRQRPGGRGRTIQYQCFNNISDQPIEIYKLEQLFEVYNYH